MVDTTRTITINGTANQIISSAGAQNLGGNRTWTLSLPQNIHTGASPTFSDLTLTGGDLIFDGPSVHKVYFESNVNPGSDKAFLYVNDNSNFHRTGTENLRFSIGAFNDFSNAITHSDAVDIQGGARLYLNVGNWDSELNSAIGTPSSGAQLDGEPIQFAVNNTKVAAFSSGGDFRGYNEVIAFYSSDKRLKDNITPIQNALSKVIKLGGYEFDWNDKQTTYEGHDIGVIAQEVEEVFPNLVETRQNGYKAVKYEKLTPLLIEAIKEQNRTIEKQQRQIDELKDLVRGILDT
jgi:hypothetical protein